MKPVAAVNPPYVTPRLSVLSFALVEAMNSRTGMRLKMRNKLLQELITFAIGFI